MMYCARAPCLAPTWMSSLCASPCYHRWMVKSSTTCSDWRCKCWKKCGSKIKQRKELRQKTFLACEQMLVEGKMYVEKKWKGVQASEQQAAQLCSQFKNKILAESSLQPRCLLGAVTPLTTDDESTVIKSVGIYKALETSTGLSGPCHRELLLSSLQYFYEITNTVSFLVLSQQLLVSIWWCVHKHSKTEFKVKNYDSWLRLTQISSYLQAIYDHPSKSSTPFLWDLLVWHYTDTSVKPFTVPDSLCS